MKRVFNYSVARLAALALLGMVAVAVRLRRRCADDRRIR